MARYATTEKQYECRDCFIKCTMREMVVKLPLANYCCPNCDEILLIESSLSGFVAAGGGLADSHHESIFKKDD